jgi:hypothetical protein
VDPQDKVYALLSLSSDGKPVMADYSISVADLFFRLLSLHPPLFNVPLCGRGSDMVFFRNHGPWEVAQRMRSCLALEESDLLASCRSSNKDRLYTWLEYLSTVASVQKIPVNQQHAESPNLAQSAFPCEVRDQSDENRVIRSSSKVRPGDETFRLGHTSYPEFYVILRPSQSNVIEIIVRDIDVEDDHLVGPSNNSATSLDEFEFLQRLCLNGMKRCRTILQRRRYDENREVVLVHITRLVFCVLCSSLTYPQR